MTLEVYDKRYHPIVEAAEKMSECVQTIGWLAVKQAVDLGLVYLAEGEDDDEEDSD